jgi:hypothetical protein
MVGLVWPDARFWKSLMASRDQESDAERILRDFEDSFGRSSAEIDAQRTAHHVSEMDRKLDYLQYAVNALRAPLWLCAVCLVVLMGKSWLG